ncbi:MAG: hypothetical protein BWZ06_00835 [Bacteroidetes bacterium ADurb.BinA261]|nr:MAG: hypothetical protein BWZ06_00835 [Bacteroidetes bacterium ADurb.BinA261]
MKRLFFGTSHIEFSAFNGNHLKRNGCSGYLFDEIFESGYNGRLFIELTGIHNLICRGRYSRHFPMNVVRIIVPCIQVATNALQIELFCVLFIIQMCCNRIVGYSFRKQILMTFHTRFVGNVFNGVFQLRFLIPIKVGSVLSQISPNVAQSEGSFRRVIIPGIFDGRKMTVNTICHHTTRIVDMGGEFP